MIVPFDVISYDSMGFASSKMRITFWDCSSLVVDVEVISKNIIMLCGRRAGVVEEQIDFIEVHYSSIYFRAIPYAEIQCSVYSKISDTLRSVGIAVGGGYL